MSILSGATDAIPDSKGTHSTILERNVVRDEDDDAQERDVEKGPRWWQRGQRTEEQKVVRRLDLVIL